MLPIHCIVCFLVFLFFVFFFGFGHTAWHGKILVSQPGIEPAPPALESRSLIH